MTLTGANQYPPSLQALEKDILKAQETYPATTLTKLATQLVDGAKRLSLKKTKNLKTHARYNGIKRDESLTPEFTENALAHAPWADNAQTPLEEGESWNEGRRATNTGIKYELDNKDRPVNPYMNTGLTGRGSLGRFGPNHAVDSGILIMKKDEQDRETLYALGILRKYDNNEPAVAGGFVEFQKTEDDTYKYDRDLVTETQARELFEEMISGSIKLQPALSHIADVHVREAIEKATQSGTRTVPEEEQKKIQAQIETEFKLKQITIHDRTFLQRLKDTMADGRECFAGPGLNDSRNTNNAWIETRLSWFLMDEKTWAYIRGENPPFPYEFSAGDDASAVVEHRLDDKLLHTAFGGHSALFGYMTASYLLDSQEKNRDVPESILEQVKTMCQYYDHMTDSKISVLHTKKAPATQGTDYKCG